MKELYTSPELQIVNFAPAHNIAADDDLMPAAESVPGVTPNPGLDLELP